MLLGTIVIYLLSDNDATLINRRRTSVGAVQNRRQRNPPEWPDGAQAHIGEVVKAGDALPLIVTHVGPDEHVVGGQVLLHGSDTYWVPSVPMAYDDAPGPGDAVERADYLKFLAVGPGRKK